MTKRTIAELVGGLVLLAVLGLYAHEQIDKWKLNIKAEAEAKVLQQAQKDKDAALAARDAEYQKQVAAKDKEIADAKQSVAQMAAYANQHTPEAPKPIVVVGPHPETVTLRPNDAVIPYESSDAFFDRYAKGGVCLSTDLPKCLADVKDWQGKYDLKDKEAKDWEIAAKGGSVWKRVWRVIKPVGCAAGAGMIASAAGAKPVMVGAVSGGAGVGCAIF